ncbi:MAG: TetR family transcriptional regulator [Alphaproteobacteria bacterium]|nr:TetR family transcriptional regulator [Alphaproteobacteria bacterium]
MSTSRREQLVETALAVFNREGFHAAGIDRILAEAGVAKMTLYNHFRSKDDLILAALRRRDEEFRNWFPRAVEARTQDPVERLSAIFDVLGDWFDAADFRGCTFINAAAEYGDHASPIHAAVAEHKRLVEGYIAELAVAAGAPAPAPLARSLMMLMEGAIVIAHNTGDVAVVAADARRSAQCHIKSALPK